MQQAPGMRREATWGLQLSWYLFKDDDDNDGWWWYQERLPAPDVHEEEKEEGGGQLCYGDRDEAVMNIIQLAVMILSTIK